MLEVEGLNVFYGDARALSDIHLVIGDGEIVSIVGPNGAGKSTLVNTLGGLLNARSGRVLVDGKDISNIPPYKIGDHGVAIVPEGRRIFSSMTVQDNLDLGCYRRKARSQRGQRLTWIQSLFPVLDDRAGQMAGTLSGGEQQMLAIARALMSEPSILLLDEPSLGLAPQVVDRIFDVLVTINQAGVSVCLVEQNVIRALELSDRGYVIQEGRIDIEGTPQSLLEDTEIRRAGLGL